MSDWLSLIVPLIQDVIDVFQPSHSLWAGFSPGAWIFRGHASDKWQLGPSIYRNDTCSKWGINTQSGVILETIIESEFELIRNFALICDSVGLQLPEQATPAQNSRVISSTPAAPPRAPPTRSSTCGSSPTIESRLGSARGRLACGRLPSLWCNPAG